MDPGAGQRVTGYCFRHSWATTAIEAGVGERQVADQLAHRQGIVGDRQLADAHRGPAAMWDR